MCGIAGIVDYARPSREHAALLREMQARLRHRGPDGEGEAFFQSCALAHTRLAMLDAANGAQPLRRGPLTLVYNGELFNDAELRAQLPGPFLSRCDAETLLAAYEQWGEACLDKLDGMFAFFLWDDERQRGFGARDRLGVKPFVFRRDGPFIFASEARALLAGRRARPNVEGILETLVAPCFSGVSRSPFADMEVLQPGALLRVSRDGVEVERWWRWRAEPSEPSPREVRVAFERAVQGATRSDAPLGIFLSGGLDSTAIAAEHPLPAWTIAFEPGPPSALCISDDLPHARAAAESLGVSLREVFVPRSALDVAGVAAANDAIPAWEQEIAQRALARAASAEVRGALVGDAADELYQGYHFVLDARGPREICERLGAVPVRDKGAPQRFDREYRALIPLDFDDPRSRLPALTQLIVERWLPRLLHNGDVHTMRFGLEARVPFASVALIELAMRSAAQDKALLRAAFAGLVPEAIHTRRKSALPKDCGAQQLYQRALQQLAMPEDGASRKSALHPLVRALVDLDALAPLLVAGPLTEAQRAQLFRVLSLHHWASAFEVDAP